jgi:crossover junction endonuclease MUS81
MAEDCANPLLLGWIKEWLDQARERNSKGATVFVQPVPLGQSPVLI